MSDQLVGQNGANLIRGQGGAGEGQAKQEIVRARHDGNATMIAGVCRPAFGLRMRSVVSKTVRVFAPGVIALVTATSSSVASAASRSSPPQYVRTSGADGAVPKTDREPSFCSSCRPHLDPTTGQFLQPDPVGHADSVNLYAGMAWDPVNLRDPTGRVNCWPWESPKSCLAKLGASSDREDDYIRKHGRSTLRDKGRFYTLGLFGMAAAPPAIVFGAQGIAAGLAEGASAYAGLGAGMGLGSAIATPPVLGAAYLAEGPAGMDEAAAVLSITASPGTLVGCAVGMTLTEGAQRSCFYGAVLGGGAEALYGLGRAGMSRLGSACRGKTCEDICFTAGTLVATASTPVAIESIQVGDRILTHQGESSTEVDDTWLQGRIAIESDRNPAHRYDVAILRPRAWWASRNADSTGKRIYFVLEELGVRGWGTVDELRQSRAKRGAGRVVVMTVSHLNNDVYEVSFVEGGEPLRGTGRHPLYSLDRDDWVRIRDLQVGERLQTAEGAVTVEALEKVRGVHRVYNLEVEGDHEYLVGEAGVRAHNTCAFAEIASTKWKGFAKPPSTGSTMGARPHLGKHASEFSFSSTQEYINAAKAFAKEAGPHIKAHRIGNIVIKYDAYTRRMFIGNINTRQIRTFYRADYRTGDPFREAVRLAEEVHWR